MFFSLNNILNAINVIIDDNNDTIKVINIIINNNNIIILLMTFLKMLTILLMTFLKTLTSLLRTLLILLMILFIIEQFWHKPDSLLVILCFFSENLWKQECIPVGCILPTSWLYPVVSRGVCIRGRRSAQPPHGCRPPLDEADADPLDADPLDTDP